MKRGSWSQFQLAIIIPPFGWPRAAIGSNIYIIGGGYVKGSYSTKLVFFIDCRSHSLHKGPSTQMARNCPLVNVIDGKIYVVKGCKNPDSSNMIEFFDPQTQIWEYLPCPSADIHKSNELSSLAINGKLYLFGDNKTVVYKTKENTWDDEAFPLYLPSRYSSCVIDNVIYYVKRLTPRIWWYDPERRSGGPLEGLEQLPYLPRHVIRMVEYGEKIMVLWETDYGYGYGEEVLPNMIDCAEIALERRNTEEIDGKIEWCDNVLKPSEPFHIVEVITATV